MRLTKKAAILKILMVLSGVFCFADIHSAYEQAVRVYTEYRKVRSVEQILNLDSIREDLLITDKMQAFSYDGIDTLIFHAYNPTIYICEDDCIARVFNGPGEQINYVPQTATLNNGEWKTMEKKWNDALSEGKKVEVDIKINYADNLRPTDFDVTYIIKTSDGKIEKTENLFFLN